MLYCSAFQSTLPRGERLTLARNFPCGVRKISIHAPARGATSEFICNFSSDIISIHAPARGATPAPSLRMPRLSYFNPRSREGSDFASFHAFFKPEISIHAPARGATRISFTSSDASTFQSTLPRGERPSPVRSHSGLRLFQSTLPRGERHHVIHVYFRLNDFNPRSREGSDEFPVPFRDVHKHFNPRSREGSDGRNVAALPD